MRYDGILADRGRGTAPRRVPASGGLDSLRHFPIAGALFGLGAVVVLPIFYGVLGLLGSMVMAALYNVAARIAGGVELELT